VHIGVDGCRAGWLAVGKESGQLQYRIFPDARALAQTFKDAQRICIDIPIGLPWRDCPIRPPDPLARRLLGARRSSVFPVPCRAAVHAQSISQARAANVGELGRSLSEQSWNISDKIAQVDRLVRGEPELTTPFREAHPELCFWALAGGRSMRHTKKTAAGTSERMTVLRRFESAAPRLIDRIMQAHPRSAVALDDVLDALVLFITACAPSSELGQLAGTPAMDEQGVRMELIFRPIMKRTASEPVTRVLLASRSTANDDT